MSWDTIESSPAIFSEMIEKFGVKNCQVEEIISLDEGTLSAFGKVHGLVFLFRWRKSDYQDDEREISKDSDVYFAKQTVQNACATQAILNILMNCGDKVEVGDMLKGFRSFTSEMSAEMRGDLIGQQTQIRDVHNSFARAEPFVSSERKAKSDDDDVFHFVAYTSVKGKVYEFDGLREGPICIGSPSDEKDWIKDVAGPEIQKRMSKFKPGEIHFNLMAIVNDRRSDAKEKIETLKKEIESIEKEAGEGPRMDTEEKLSLKRSQVQELESLVQSENSKRQRWKSENMRRRHNYVPLIVALLKKLAKAGKLKGLREKGKEYYQEQVKARRERESKKKGTEKK